MMSRPPALGLRSCLRGAYRTLDKSSIILIIVMAMAGVMSPRTASAAVSGPSGPAWELSSVAQPTNFSAEDNALCARERDQFCDRYTVTITNVGRESTDPVKGLVTIADTLPPGLKLISFSGENLETAEALNCEPSTTLCTDGNPIAPGATLVIYVEVEVTSAVGEITNRVTVSGGGAPPAATSPPLSLPNGVGGPASTFGIAAFGFTPHDASGQLDTQAGEHPYGLTTSVNFSTAIKAFLGGELIPASVEPPKDLVVYPPLGFLGDPTATGRCTETQLIGRLGEDLETECPADSRVGTVVAFYEKIVTGTIVSPSGGGVTTALYNMVPEAGYPAQFGFKLAGKAIPIYASLVHTDAGYGLRIGTPGIPITVAVEGVEVTFFSNPKAYFNEPSEGANSFLTNPTNCNSGPLTTRAEADSWVHPHQWVSAESVAYPAITGCNLLQFEPTVEMRPEVTQAEAPSGYEIKIKLHQNPEQFPVLATSQLRNVTMTLPEGMTIAPGGGDGLEGCAATGAEGIDMPTDLPGGANRTPTEVGEGEAIGPDGMSHLTPGNCPHQSQIGTVEITTPVLKSPLEGHIYVAQPKCGGPGQAGCTAADAMNGNLFGLYLEAEGSGVVVKLAGKASVDPSTGRITAQFLENPQLPVSEVTLNLKGGERAPLANPRECGPASSDSALTPWSAPQIPSAIVGSAPFDVVWNATGEAPAGCPGTLPFAPTLLAGPTNVRGGAFGSFTLTVTRGDRQQDVRRLQVHMPVGLLGMLSKIALCPEAQANAGTCGVASEIGTVNVAAGSGAQPLWVTGRVYLTGSYEGAPFGLSVVVPAVAGPFNLGNVIVRSRIDIDPLTSAVTITTDPLPQILDGIPLRIRTLNVAVTREGFLFNPTHCQGLAVTASIDAEQGASANLTSAMPLEGCSRLPFAPTFKASTSAKTTKAKGASLKVTVTAAPGQANVGRVVVTLPKQLPARLTTLQQACTETMFATNPAACPAASVVGTAKAVTPILSEAVTGPVYLVSHGGAAFPDVVVILQGEGVRVDLVGNTSIKGLITTSTFASVPDAPISSFEINLPQGAHSALGSNLPAKAKGSFCSTALTMPTTITGQNGAVIQQNTKISVSGCPKAKPKPKKKHKKKPRKK
jgi:uncharacterized repeat protein (TIGR01451 family)